MGPKVVWGGPSGNHHGGTNSVSQVMKSQICICPQALWRRAQQSNNGLCQHFCLRECCPSSSCPVASYFSLSLYVSSAFQAADPALEPRGSDSWNKSVCGPFKRNCLVPQKFLSSSTSTPAGFYSHKLWGFPFLALEP